MHVKLQIYSGQEQKQKQIHNQINDTITVNNFAEHETFMIKHTKCPGKTQVTLTKNRKL